MENETKDKRYVNGMLDPKSTDGWGVITEYVVSEVLNDCIKCNVIGEFRAKYDLISRKYGTINVKSSKLIYEQRSNCYRWTFSKKKTAIIPDYYICIGFNEEKTVIDHVWIIPGNSKQVKLTGIKISNGMKGMNKFLEYEVDASPYHNLYISLDIYTLPEFCNYNNIEEFSI